MPKISQAFSVIKVSLPSYPESEVEIKTNVSVGEVMEVEKTESNMERAVFMALRMIIKWNFQDESGAELPVTKENLIQLPATDLTFLLETITPYVQKKTSEKTSL